jgi:hypothetical protein
MLKRTVLLITSALLAFAPAAFAGGGHGHGHGHGGAPKVVATGLDNPRGIDVDPVTGAVYVAEAGRGGAGPCITGGDSDVPQCLGQSGAITRIGGRGHQRRVAEGLPSIAGPDGSGASGPQDVDIRGFGFGSFIVGLGGNPADRASLGEAGAGLASIFSLTPWGRVTKRADLGDYEVAADPDKDQPGSEGVDSNPTSVLNRRRGYVAVDAGGNDLLRVRRNGDVSTIAVFPFRTAEAPPFLGLPPGTQIPLQPVPTGVVRGPDRAYYVSQLTGFPFPAGAANIYRVVPGSAPTVYASGLTNVTDLAFGRDGSLYAVEISKGGLLSEASETDSVGALVKVAPGGSEHAIVADDLPSPYGVATGRHGDIYVTTHSSAAGSGEVLRVR